MILTYKGDITGSVVGRVFQSNGEVFEAVRAEYGPLTDTTAVEFERAWSTDERSVLPDRFGEVRIDA